MLRDRSDASRCASCSAAVAMPPRAAVAACSSRSTNTKKSSTSQLDGSATLNVNASVASLVALRGVDLPTDPRARLDRERVRALFAGPGSQCRASACRAATAAVSCTSASTSTMCGSWRGWRRLRGRPTGSSGSGDRVDTTQMVGTLAGRAGRRDVGWDGTRGRRVPDAPAERDPLPQHAARRARGNILEWEQPLARPRSSGVPLELRVHDGSRESILYTTLLLFGGTIVAAAAAFALSSGGWRGAARNRMRPGPSTLELLQLLLHFVARSSTRSSPKTTETRRDRSRHHPVDVVVDHALQRDPAVLDDDVDRRVDRSA